MMKKLSSHYQVRHHNPLRAGLLYILCVILFAGALWSAYEYGRYKSGNDYSAQVEQIQVCKKRIAELEVKNKDMMQSSIVLESSSQIDVKARQEVAQKLEKVNEEMLELKEELVFYRSLLSPSEQDPELRIQNFRLVEDSKPQQYSYRLMVAQLRKHDKFASGTVNLYLQGVDVGNEVRSYAFKDLSDDKKDVLFNFKYFQNIEGSLTLPENFKPGNIRVQVIPKGRDLQSLEQTYEWNAVIAGG